MSSGERPIGATKGKQPNTEALCQIPPGPPLPRPKGPSSEKAKFTRKGPQRRLQTPLDRWLEGVAKAVGGGFCWSQMPLTLALGVRETVAGHRLGALEGGGGGGGASNTPTTGLRERGNDTSKSTGRSGRQNAATRRNMRREERVTVQGPAKEQQPDVMSHTGGTSPRSNASLPHAPVPLNCDKVTPKRRVTTGLAHGARAALPPAPQTSVVAGGLGPPGPKR